MNEEKVHLLLKIKTKIILQHFRLTGLQMHITQKLRLI